MGFDWIAAFDLWHCSLNSFCSKIHSQSDPTQFDLSLIKENFKDVFSSQLVRCTKTKVKLILKNNSKLIFSPKRTITYAILPLVDAELSRLEQNEIISPIKHSDWTTPIAVIRKKNGSVMICPDFSTGLNELLEPNRHPFPLPDEIFSQFSNYKYFSQLDLFSQSIMDSMISGLENVFAYIDDIVVGELQFKSIINEVYVKWLGLDNHTNSWIYKDNEL
ncbi:Uncharacterized protein K02A2.6 [Cyphomyrmex costatus]|uniref:Uncharacterized protein K02A2.6 n=1 Tax=Cyphomyrmex costatus TaxID=456900 RepID=A0A151IHL3_9HYME|nr:Uncharacterized protein K02A2.6 [Cyphomyrmex costatus]